jgi:hypothetical protein
VSEPDEKLVPRLAFARALGVSPRTLDAWARGRLEGVPLPCRRRGSRVGFTWRDYESWQAEIDRRRGPPRAPTGGGRRAKRRAEECLRGHGVPV